MSRDSHVSRSSSLPSCANLLEALCHVTETETWGGAALEAARKRANLTQEDLGKKAGVDRTTINALEKGRRQMSDYYAGKLARHVRLKPDALLPPPPTEDSDPTVDPLLRLAKLEGEFALLASLTVRALELLEAPPALLAEARRLAGGRASPGG